MKEFKSMMMKELKEIEQISPEPNNYKELVSFDSSFLNLG